MAQFQKLLIKGGIYHFSDREPVEGLDLLTEGNTILKIGENLDADAQIIQAGGKHILPGFILPVTTMGIADQSYLVQGDANEAAVPVNAGLHVKYALDSREVAIQEYHISGVTSFGASPGRNALIAGQMGVYHTVGRNARDMCVRETVALKGNFVGDVKTAFGGKGLAPMTRMGMAAGLREALRSGAEYNPEKNGVDEGLAALQKVVRGELPLLMNAEQIHEITSVLSIAKEFGAKLILHGGYQAGEIPEVLLEEKSPLLLGDLFIIGASIAYKADLPALLKLREGGLPVAISNSGDMSTGGHQPLLWNGARLVQEGLDPEEAVRMMSIDTAKILGIDDLTGSLEEGKLADISIFSAHPMMTWAAHVDTCIVGGNPVYLKEGASCC